MKYDELLASKITPEDHIDLCQAYVIDAQNVANYMFSDHYRENHPRWRLSDMPNVAPPFQRLWIEYRTPRFAFNEDIGPTPLHFGTLIRSIDLKQEGPAAMDRLAKEYELSPLDAAMILPTYRWFCQALVYDFWPNPRAFGTLSYGVKHDGKLSFIKGSKHFVFKEGIKELADRERIDLKTLSSKIEVGLFVPMMALTFSHCKNVRIEKAPTVSEKLQAARVRRGKPRLTRPNIIVIEPMKQAIRSGGHHEFSEKAMHIVRGHFRTYDEKPLFGKYTGTFWVESHVSGSKVGIPEKKTYVVKSPE